jgi:hypothetical protein
MHEFGCQGDHLVLLAIMSDQGQAQEGGAVHGTMLAPRQLRRRINLLKALLECPQPCNCRLPPAPATR